MRTQKTLLSIADFPSENTVYQRTGILKHFFTLTVIRILRFLLSREKSHSSDNILIHMLSHFICNLNT